MRADDAITEVEQHHFHTLVDVLTTYDPGVRPAVMRATLHGRDVAVVVAISADGEMFRADPLAVLVDQHLMEQLVPPGDVNVVRNPDYVG